MARVEGGAVVIDTDWPGLKNQIDIRKVNFKYEEDDTAYQIFAIDGQYFYQTVIYKSGQAPQNQATYDTWRSEFESDYKNRITDFNSTQPFYISNVDGYSIVLKDGATPTANDGYGIAIIGYDGTNYRMTRMDSSGRQILVGAGTAGTPAGGVISIQGVVSGTAIPVSGTISVSGTTVVSGTVAATQSGTWTVQPGNTANTTPWLMTINQGGNSATVTAANALKIDGSAVTQPVSGTVTANAGTGTFTVSGTVTANAGTGNFNNASVSAINAAVPASATFSGFSDGTNVQSARVFDVDTGGGTQYVQGVNLRLSAGGGSVEFGTNTNPIRVDPTGSTTQPISGTVTANIGTSGALALEATQLKLTIAQSTALGTNTQVLIGGSVTTGVPTYTTGNINPLSLTTSGALRVDSSFTTQPISGTVTANAGTGNFTVVQSTASNLRSQTSSESNTGSAIPTQASMVGGSDGTNLRAIFLDTSGRQIIIGGAANGAAVAGNPVLIAGSDGTNARSIRTATDGTVRVDPTGTTTQPVSGTVAATQSGAWTVTANAGTGNFTVIGTATDNTANSTAKLPVMAARANTAAPSWSDGNMVPLSTDLTGALRITGSISATNPSVGTNNSAIPTSSTQIGGSDGTNLQAARVFDGDTGAGTQWILGVGLRKFASGGTVELGTSSDPIRIDPTGTTTQPVSSTQLPAALVGSRLDINNGAWLGSTAPTVGSKTSANSIPVVIASDQGTVTVNASATVGIVDNAVFTDGTTRIQPVGFIFDEVAGTALTENDGAAARVDSKRAQVMVIEDTTTRGQRLTITASNAMKVDGSAVTQPISAASLPLPTGAATEATLSTRLADATFTGRINTLGQKTMANSTPIVIASDQSVIPVSQSGTWTVQQGTPPWSVVGPGATGAALSGNPVRVAGSDGTNTRNITTDTSGRLLVSGAGASGAAATGNPVLVAGSDGTNARTIRTETDGTVRTKEQRSSTPAVTSVAASVSNVTLLASNTNRLGATIYNDSNQPLYLKLGATASTTSFTVKMNKDDYYEVPFNYTGIIDGIWSSASGSARITEIS